ncbi:putative HSP20-like chaperones superfamily protein [Hibiscus syriacus]|uniref:HSP20-like chaperones superfamily protein n=1 Tax=Hibiscus syriacus TaxID=106335 RepID=A0A6A3ART2_HIBSY|nr:16.9 kDa class I heat shock protein 1-like [Hibiscus syriacus]KAE8707400.1 putative HSP20-like chaperones superfamily protein [Hibiscus syriacus]
MANVGDQRSSGNRVAQKFEPSSDWTHDDKASYLFLDLPGFKKEQLRLELASTGHIIISGERVVDENKSIYFEQSFPLPDNSDTDKVNGKFDGEFLHVTVPKLSVAEEENHAADGLGEASVPTETYSNHDENQSKHEDHERRSSGGIDEASKEGNRVASFPEEMVKKWEGDEGPLEMAIKFIKENRGAVVSVIIALSAGVFICRTFD